MVGCVAASQLLPRCGKRARSFVPDLRSHPGVTLATYNIPLTVSQDDPGLFNTHPLTHDVFAAYVSFDYDLATLKQMGLDSLDPEVCAVSRNVSLMEAAKNRFLGAWDEWVENTLAIYEQAEQTAGDHGIPQGYDLGVALHDDDCACCMPRLCLSLRASVRRARAWVCSAREL